MHTRTDIERISIYRSGFTVVELIVAIALAAIVTVGVGSVFTLVRALDGATATASERAVDHARAHATMQRAFGSLIAAAPLRSQVSEDGSGDGDPAEGGRADDLALPPEVRDQVRALFGEGGEDGGGAPGLDARLAATVAVADTSQPPFFELFYERVGVDGIGEVVLPRLAVTMTALPIDARTDAERALSAKWRGISRGVFELLLEPGTGTWTLAFTATDPPAPPVPLLGGIEFLEVTALEPDEEATDFESRSVTSEWRTLYAAYLREDFPDAVRVYMELASGEVIDWMFETTVLSEGGR